MAQWGRGESCLMDVFYPMRHGIGATMVYMAWGNGHNRGCWDGKLRLKSGAYARFCAQGWPSGLGSELIIRLRQVRLLHPGLLGSPHGMVSNAWGAVFLMLLVLSP